MNSQSKIKILCASCFIGSILWHSFFFYNRCERVERMSEHRKELAALTSNRRTVKAYVYETKRKSNQIFYRFTLNGVVYSGCSHYSLYQSYPGDSIWVYYKEDDPNVNLWVGMFEY